MGEAFIGESYLVEASAAVGRSVRVNLMQISGDIKNQSSDVKFEITGASENKLNTRITGYYFSPAAIKRFVRRHMTRIDDSLVIQTSDNLKVKIKPFLLTRSKVSRAVEHQLRVSLREELINGVRKTSYDNLFSMVLKYQLQKDIKEKLSKIYPVKNIEIRILEEEKDAAARESEMPVKKVFKKVKSKKSEEQEEVKESTEQPEQPETPEKQ
jgi:ribosomal protein S3AE